MNETKSIRPSIKEQEITKKNYLEQLREKHKEHSLNTIQKLVRQLKMGISHYHADVIPKDYRSSMRDNIFGPSSILALSEMGILNDIASVQPRNRDKINTSQGPVTVERLDKARFGLSFGDEVDLDKAAKMVNQRINSTDIAKILLQISNSVLDIATTDQPLTFSLDQDLLGSAAVLDKLCLLGWAEAITPINPDDDFAEVIAKVLQQGLINKASFNENDEIKSVKFSPVMGINIVLTPLSEINSEANLLTTKWSMQLMIDEDHFVFETANQSKRSKCEAFISRPTGIAITQALESSNLKFSNSFEDMIVSGRSYEFDDRYGGIYTHISRVIAKALWAKDIDKLSSVFQDLQDNTPTTD